MAIPKVMGTETEYGITVPSAPEFNPVLGSSLLINAYAAQALRRVRWDYEEESPLRDARGFDLRTEAGESVTDGDLGLANVILTNGSRYYVDHAHPEYSTPECTNPRDLVVHDRAGERILEESLKRAGELVPGQGRMLIFKNNTDGKGSSYGTHENYLVDRGVPFARLVHDILPFFVTRQIFAGAGLLGGQAQGWEAPYQISQRADFFEVEVGLETTLKRPIVNTRDEPHADPEKYRRLHVIIGDANLSQVATFLKVGTTAIVLKMIEDEAITEDLTFENSVQALRGISHDASCRHVYKLRHGRTVRAVDVQWAYHELAQKYFARHDPDPWTAEVMTRWETALAGLERDPFDMHRWIDWVAKFRVLDGYRVKHGLDWRDSKLHLMDLQYHDVRRDKGLAYLLERSGKLETLVDEADVERAMTEPPEDTRAYFRGRCLARFSRQIAAASWDSIIFDTGGESLQRVPMLEPLRGTRGHVEKMMAEVPDAASLVDRLQG